MQKNWAKFERKNIFYSQSPNLNGNITYADGYKHLIKNKFWGWYV